MWLSWNPWAIFWDSDIPDRDPAAYCYAGELGMSAQILVSAEVQPHALTELQAQQYSHTGGKNTEMPSAHQDLSRTHQVYL